ncbi:ABC transporter ATP-binding protein [Microbacterium sp. KR10-403]|uniref:ABC transporter ATP-binding protein n=1 Tax=Microbacterium sp. KR10-403 TaxID=3158581 RepID=UPI0032E4B905
MIDVEAIHGTPALRLQDVSIGYSHFADAVSSISFTLERGRRVGIIGESGCGKSTLGLAIMGLLPWNGEVRAGNILIDGADMVTMRERERRRLRGNRVGLIYQDASSSLDPLKRVGTQIAEAITAHAPKTKQINDRVAHALDDVGLAAANAQNYPHELSGGMRQRVAIAIALVNDPVLVIADEPTTALDVTTQAHVLDLLEARVTERDAALLLITHDLGVVADRCELTGVMYRGRLVEWGDTSRVLTDPEHPYTRALVECSHAVIDSDADRLPTMTSWDHDEEGGDDAL